MQRLADRFCAALVNVPNEDVPTSIRNHINMWCEVIVHTMRQDLLFAGGLAPMNLDLPLAKSGAT